MGSRATLTSPASAAARGSSRRRRGPEAAVAVIGLLHPGEMGAALGAELRRRGHTVLWASSGRGAATNRRAAEAGLRDVVATGELARRSGVILSVCPPHAARAVAQSVAGFEGVFVDANAVSPETSRAMGATIEARGGRYVDAGIIGSAPRSAGTTRLYLSGPDAQLVADLFEGTAVDARLVSGLPGAASAVKMAYAAWTKGTAALLLAVRAVARAEGVEETLLDEWRESLPDLLERSRRAAAAARAKGWRWVGEMEEIASTFAADGLPDGFHHAAAEVFAAGSTRSSGSAALDTDAEAALVADANVERDARGRA